jgi:hypothetical protein
MMMDFGKTRPKSHLAQNGIQSTELQHWSNDEIVPCEWQRRRRRICRSKMNEPLNFKTFVYGTRKACLAPEGNKRGRVPQISDSVLSTVPQERTSVLLCTSSDGQTVDSITAIRSRIAVV